MKPKATLPVTLAILALAAVINFSARITADRASWPPNDRNQGV